MVRVVSVKLRLQSTMRVAAVPQGGTGLNILMFLHLWNRHRQLHDRVKVSPEFHPPQQQIHLRPNKHGYVMIAHLMRSRSKRTNSS